MQIDFRKRARNHAQIKQTTNEHQTNSRPGAAIADPVAPRIIRTAQTGRIIPAPPAELQPAVEPGRRRYGLSMKLAVAGLLLAFCGWLGVDLYLWIASAFNFSMGLGWAAVADRKSVV